MTPVFKRLSLTAAMSFALSACGGDSPAEPASSSGDHSRTQLSFLDQYIASQNIPPKAAPMDLTGQWSGLLQCGGDFPITIDVGADDNAIISIAPMIGKEIVKSPLRFTYVDTSAAVTLQHDTRSFWMKSPATKDSASVSFQITGILDPQSEDMALIHPYEMRGNRRARSCDFGVITRSDEGRETLAQMQSVLATLYGNRQPVLNQDCPPAYKTWLTSAMAKYNANPRGADMTEFFTGSVFEERFGVRYDEADAQTLIDIGRVLTGSCLTQGRNPEQRNQRIYEMRMISGVSNHRSYQAYRHADFKRDIGGAWLEWMRNEVGRKAPMSRRELSVAANVPRTYKLSAVGLEADTVFSANMLAYSAQLEESSRTLDFLATIEAAKGDFKTLLAKRQIAEANETYDASLAAQALDAYLVPAAQALAKAPEVGEAVYMATWAQAQGNGAACPAYSTETCDTAAELFVKAANTAAEDFAETEKMKTAALYPKKAPLADLKASITAEQFLRRQYGILFETEAFEDVRASLAKRRRALQKVRKKDLIAMAKASDTAPQLKAIKSTYFLDEDLQQPAMKAVLKTIDETLEDTSPFRGMFGAAYFNALYNRDFNELRRLDAYYLESIQPLMDFGTQQAAALGPLLDAITGSAKGTTQNDIRRSVANLSALYPVMGTYLVEYQKAYKSCLEPNAVTYSITQRTDRVTTDGLGRELNRVKGWTREDTYTINREFAQNFDQLFGTATDDGRTQLFDMFLNDGRVTRLRRSMNVVMKDYKCSSDEIQQLERGMLAYDRDVTRRMRGR